MMIGILCSKCTQERRCKALKYIEYSFNLAPSPERFCSTICSTLFNQRFLKHIRLHYHTSKKLSFVVAVALIIVFIAACRSAFVVTPKRVYVDGKWNGTIRIREAKEKEKESYFKALKGLDYILSKNSSLATDGACRVYVSFSAFTPFFTPGYYFEVSIFDDTKNRVFYKRISSNQYTYVDLPEDVCKNRIYVARRNWRHHDSVFEYVFEKPASLVFIDLVVSSNLLFGGRDSTGVTTVSDSAMIKVSDYQVRRLPIPETCLEDEKDRFGYCRRPKVIERDEFYKNPFREGVLDLEKED